MNFETILLPITAAMMVNIVLFAVLWRGDRREISEGKETWYQFPLIAGYSGPLAVFLYFYADRPIKTFAETFGMALAAQAFGAVIVWMLLKSFIYDRGQPWRERAILAFAGVALTLAAFSGFFTAT